MSWNAHFKELSDDMFFMTYNPYFVDQNYESKFDNKNKVALYKGMKGVFFSTVFISKFELSKTSI